MWVYMHGVHVRACHTHTCSKTSGSPAHELLPLSGPNIGWRHRMSETSGSALSITSLAYCFTESTSTTSAERSSAGGSEASTFSKERIETEITTTSSSSAGSSAADVT